MCCFCSSCKCAPHNGKIKYKYSCKWFIYSLRRLYQSGKKKETVSIKRVHKIMHSWGTQVCVYVHITINGIVLKYEMVELHKRICWRTFVTYPFQFFVAMNFRFRTRNTRTPLNAVPPACRYRGKWNEQLKFRFAFVFFSLSFHFDRMKHLSNQLIKPPRGDITCALNQSKSFCLSTRSFIIAMWCLVHFLWWHAPCVTTKKKRKW